MRKRRTGFTLIELIIVILIMSMIAGLAVLSVQGHVDRARVTRCFEQIDQLDRLGRWYARREEMPYLLTYSRSKKKVTLRPMDISSSKVKTRERKIPSTFEFATFQQGPVSKQVDEMKIEIAANGQSSSYAFALKPGSGPSQWSVTLGMSGQQIKMEKSKDVAALFQ